MSIPTHTEELIKQLKTFDKKDLIVAEIGIWKTKSTKTILYYCKDIISQYWGIDIFTRSDWWSYRSIDDKTWDALYKNACKLMIKYPIFHMIRMSSIEASTLFPTQYFDLVFLDADHSYDAIVNDIKTWMPLVKNGGLLTGHDYGGKHEGVKKAVDEYFDDAIIGEGGVWIKEIN